MQNMGKVLHSLKLCCWAVKWNSYTAQTASSSLDEESYSNLKGDFHSSSAGVCLTQTAIPCGCASLCRQLCDPGSSKDSPILTTGIKWVSLAVSEPSFQYFIANTLPTTLFTWGEFSRSEVCLGKDHVPHTHTKVSREHLTEERRASTLSAFSFGFIWYILSKN